MWVLIILIAIMLIIFIIVAIKKARIKYNNSLFIFGGIKSGKTLTAVKIGINQFKINCKKVKRKNKRIKIGNFFRKIFKKELKKPLLKPQFYSNFPIKVSKKYGMSLKLRANHLMFKDKIVENSIIIADEFGTIASQYAYENEKVTINISEFCRLFGHYCGKWGLLIMIDQDAERVSKEVRMSVGTAYECEEFKKIGILATNKVIKYINLSQKDYVVQKDQIKRNYFLLLKKHYDPQAYSIRYTENVEFRNEKETNKSLKQKELLRLDNRKSDLDKAIERKEKEKQSN